MEDFFSIANLANPAQKLFSLGHQVFLEVSLFKSMRYTETWANDFA
jgi:hypothetical protein